MNWKRRKEKERGKGKGERGRVSINEMKEVDAF